MSHNGPNSDHPVSRPPVTDPAVLVMLAFRARYGFDVPMPETVIRDAPGLVLRRGLSPCDAVERVLVDYPHPG